MPFRFGAVAWILIGLQIALSQQVCGLCRSSLNVTNDGPAILDVPIALTARLDCPNLDTELLYLFEDDEARHIEVVGRELAEAQFTYSGRVGERTVRVIAFLQRQFQVAYGETKFQVQEFLPGSLTLSGGGVVRDASGRRYAATGSNATVSAELRLPPRLLAGTEFSYSWKLGEERFTTERPVVGHRFAEPGRHWVRVAVVGRIPTSGGSFQYKWGYFDEEITVKDPFSSINISGNTYLEHGQLLDLDISCNGSGPVQYCWKVLPQTGNQTNLSCADPVISTQCSFPILYYFRDPGDYRLAIYVNNTITSMQRNIGVHIYDGPDRWEPRKCRRHAHLDVETADFDLREETSKMAVETSWEVMRRSLLHWLLIHRWCTETAPAPASYGTMQANHRVGTN